MNDKIYSEYKKDNLTAKVIYSHDTWGITKFRDDKCIERVLFTGKSEAWAESAAENFVLGILE